MPSLNVDVNGQLVAFTTEQITAFDIKRRGMRDGDHVSYNFGPDGAGCTRKFSCAWDERFNAAIYFAGAVAQYSLLGDARLSRLMPQADPDFPNWVCTKCEIMPWRFLGTIEAGAAGSEAMPEYERAELICTYEMVPFELASDEDTLSELDRYVTAPGNTGTEITTETSYIGLQGGALAYVTDTGSGRPTNIPIPYSVGFPETTSKFKVIWRRVADLSWGAGKPLTDRVIGTAEGRGYIGAINKTDFLQYPEGHLQLIGVETRRLPDPTGIGYSWDIGYLFSQKPVPFGQLGFYFHDTVAGGGVSGYYQVLRPKAAAASSGQNVLLSTLGDDDSLFHAREFGDLFVVGTP